MATTIKTISVDSETQDILERIKDRGIGASMFVRIAAKKYFNNGYQFIDADDDSQKEQESDGAAI